MVYTLQFYEALEILLQHTTGYSPQSIAEHVRRPLSDVRRWLEPGPYGRPLRMDVFSYPREEVARAFHLDLGKEWFAHGSTLRNVVEAYVDKFTRDVIWGDFNRETRGGTRAVVLMCDWISDHYDEREFGKRSGPRDYPRPGDIQHPIQHSRSLMDRIDKECSASAQSQATVRSKQVEHFAEARLQSVSSESGNKQSLNNSGKSLSERVDPRSPNGSGSSTTALYLKRKARPKLTILGSAKYVASSSILDGPTQISHSDPAMLSQQRVTTTYISLKDAIEKPSEFGVKCDGLSAELVHEGRAVNSPRVDHQDIKSEDKEDKVQPIHGLDAGDIARKQATTHQAANDDNIVQGVLPVLEKRTLPEPRLAGDDTTAHLAAHEPGPIQSMPKIATGLSIPGGRYVDHSSGVSESVNSLLSDVIDAAALSGRGTDSTYYPGETDQESGFSSVSDALSKPQHSDEDDVPLRRLSAAGSSLPNRLEKMLPSSKSRSYLGKGEVLLKCRYCRRSKFASARDRLHHMSYNCKKNPDHQSNKEKSRLRQLTKAQTATSLANTMFASLPVEDPPGNTAPTETIGIILGDSITDKEDSLSLGVATDNTKKRRAPSRDRGPSPPLFPVKFRKVRNTDFIIAEHAYVSQRSKEQAISSPLQSATHTQSVCPLSPPISNPLTTESPVALQPDSDLSPGSLHSRSCKSLTKHQWDALCILLKIPASCNSIKRERIEMHIVVQCRFGETCKDPAKLLDIILLYVESEPEERNKQVLREVLLVYCEAGEDEEWMSRIYRFLGQFDGADSAFLLNRFLRL